MVTTKAQLEVTLPSCTSVTVQYQELLRWLISSWQHAVRSDLLVPVQLMTFCHSSITAKLVVQITKFPGH